MFKPLEMKIVKDMWVDPSGLWPGSATSMSSSTRFLRALAPTSIKILAIGCNESYWLGIADYHYKGTGVNHKWGVWVLEVAFVAKIDCD